MRIYRIEARIVTDLLSKDVQFVDFLMERTKTALLLEREEKGVFYASILLRCTRPSRVSASVLFHDFELDYIYREEKELEPPCTLQLPAHFDYPFHVDHSVMILITVTEVGVITSDIFGS
jgi:hypothetical protein